MSARTVVVLSNGGVVTLEPWHDDVDAIIEGWALGQAGGGAIADVLTGRTNPSGRLVETIPYRLNDTSSFINFPGEAGHVRYGEGVPSPLNWAAALSPTTTSPTTDGPSRPARTPLNWAAPPTTSQAGQPPTLMATQAARHR